MKHLHLRRKSLRLPSLLLIIILASCSTFRELTVEEQTRGEYLFNLKLKKEYTTFLSKEVFNYKTTVFAGPAMYSYTNGQPIVVELITPNDASNSVYKSKSGANIEYLHHFIRSTGERSYKLSFNTIFRSMGQNEAHTIDIILTLTCKKELSCSGRNNEDYFHHDDPYEFSFALLPQEKDFFSTFPLPIENFSDSDQTAIKNRMIYRGMSQAAAEAAIGKMTQYIHGYYNVRYREGIVYDFEFKFGHALHYFNRY